MTRRMTEEILLDKQCHQLIESTVDSTVSKASTVIDVSKATK